MAKQCKATYSTPRKTEMYNMLPRRNLESRRNLLAHQSRIQNEQIFVPNCAIPRFINQRTSLQSVASTLCQTSELANKMNRESPKAIERRLLEDITVPFLAPDEKFIFKMGVRHQFFQTLPSRDSRLLPSERDDASNQLMTHSSVQKRTAFWLPIKPSISFANEMLTSSKVPLGASQVIHAAILNFIFDDIKLSIGTSFYYMDRYTFKYHAKAFLDHQGFHLSVFGHKVSREVMVKVINWMICDMIKLPLENNFLPMFMTAKFLNIREMLEQFWFNFCISGKLGLWEQHAFEVYLLATQMQCGDMMAAVVGRIRRMFLPLVASQEFLLLDISQAIHLLKQDTICVNSEDEIFFAAVRWLEHDWTSREEYVMEIMKTVRFPFVSPWLQRSIIHHPENEFIRKLGTNIQLRSIMWDAFGNADSDITAEDFSQREKYLLLGKYTERYWIYSLGVPHHHDVRCPQYRQLTYEAFKYFLICLQNYSFHFMDGLKYIPCKHGNTYRCCKDIQFSFNETQCFSSPRIYSMMR